MKRILLIAMFVLGLLNIVSPAAAAGVAAGQRAFISYQVANPLPLFTTAVDNPDVADPDQIATKLLLGTPVRVTKGPVKQGDVVWWRVSSFQGDGWIQDTVTIDGKPVTTLVPSTPDRFNSVIKALANVIKTNPTAEAYDSRGLAYLGLSYIGQVNYEAAAADFANAVKLDPNSAWAYAHQAEALREMNRYKAALASIDKALAISAEEVAFIYLRANINFSLERYTDALDDANKASSLKPDFTSAQLMAALASESAGSSPETIAQQIVGADPGYADAWRVLARFAISQGDVEGAKKYFASAIDAEPGEQGYVSRAYFEIDELQDYAAAEADLNQALKIAPNSARVFYALGYFYGTAKQDNKTAATYFSKDVKLDPYDTDGYLQLSAAYLALDQADNAIAAARQAIDVSPDTPCACGYLKLGNAYYVKGQFQFALDAYKSFKNFAVNVDVVTSGFVDNRIQELELRVKQQ